jgi:hypothetical protein
MSKTIEIIVAPDGTATIQTRGFAGSSCRDATRLLEAALGEVTGERLTAEFHQSKAYQQQKTENR